MHKHIITLGLLGGIATMPFATTAMAEPFNGFYIGAQAGYDKSQIDVDVDDADVDISKDGSGLAYGAFVGYNFKLARSFVIGAEADMSLNNNDFNFSDGVTVFDVDSGRTLGLSGRAGFLFGQNILLYGKAGYVNSRFTLKDGLAENNDNFNGIRYGGGVEFALLNPITFRLEYTHTDYKTHDISDISLNGKSQFDRGQIMAGVALAF